MKKNSWLNLGKFFMTLAFAVLWTACSDDSVVKPVIEESAAGRAGAGITTVEDFGPVPIRIETSNGNVTNYTVSAVATWNGGSGEDATTTWTYTIGHVDGPTDLSHAVLGGLDCNPTVISSTDANYATEAEGDRPGGGTKCNVTGGLLKNDNLTGTTFTVTYVFKGALSVVLLC